MANEKRLIDANALKRQFVDYVRTPPHFHYGDWQNMCINGTEIDEVIENAPTVDAVEVVRIDEVKQKILETLDTLMAMDVELANYDGENSYYRGKANAFEIAYRLVNAALTDLAKMDGGNEDGQD